MIHLDIVRLLYECIKITISFVTSTINSLLLPYINLDFGIVEKLFPFQLSYVLLIEKLQDFYIDFLIPNTPPTFFSCIRIVLIAFRNLMNIRLVLAWFPNINPWYWPWPILTEPVDMILRPLSWRFPKIFQLDFSTWAIFYTFDSLIVFLGFLSEMSDRYYGLI